MAMTGAGQEWVTGSYLHRLYLNRNPLFSSGHTSSDTSKIDTILTKRVEGLKKKENELLDALAKQFGGSSAEKKTGDSIIYDLFAGSDTALKQMIECIKPLLKKGEKFDLSLKENREKIKTAIVNCLLGEKEANSKYEKEELAELYENAYQEVIKEIGDIINDSKKSASGNLYAYEGFLFEPLVKQIYVCNVLDEVNKLKDPREQKDFLNWATDVTKIALLTGDERWSVEEGDITGPRDRNSSYDIVLNVKVDGEIKGLPVQLKAKPKSKEPVIQMVQRMEIDTLLDQELTNSVTKKAVKTALINQHYWGTKSYKNLVEATMKKKGEKEDLNIRSAHPTALERFDTSQTLEVLQPMIPILSRAIFSKLVIGISNKLEDRTLVWVVAAPSGYQLMRSSSILEAMMGMEEHEMVNGKEKGLKGIQSSGRMKYKVDSKSENIVDTQVEEFYGDPGTGGLSRAEWYANTANTVDKVYERMAITLSFNYSGV